MSDIVETIKQRVIDASNDPQNIFSPGAWENHIKLVFEFGRLLADKLNADTEIVDLAALLHDIASLLRAEWVKNHHVHSVKIAKEWLSELNYPPERVEQVCHCIYAHRAIQSIPRQTKEADCVASADAMSHIVHFPSLLRLALIANQLELKEAVSWSLEKIKKSYEKLLPEAKPLIQAQYDAIFIMCSYIDKSPLCE